MTSTHVVGRQILDVEVEGDHQLAFGLMDRMADLNRLRFSPVIERILDQLDQPDLTLRIDRLDVDLGTVSAARPEEAADRLALALTRALASKVAGARLTVTPIRQVRREAVETYLLSGAWPTTGPRQPGRPAAELEACARADPAAFASLVRRYARRSGFLRRLAEQAPPSVLADLLRQLEPENAALILAHMDEMAETHRVEPVARLAAAPFSRLLWRLTLGYVLIDAGSRFNRLEFVRSLVRGVARSEGLDYEELLSLIRRALALTRRNRPISLSLPGLLDEIAGPQEPAAAKKTASKPPVDIEAYIRSGKGPSAAEVERAIFEAAEGNPRDLAALFHRQVWSEAMLRRLVETLGSRARECLLGVLRPAEARLILDYMAEVGRLHRLRPITPISPDIQNRRLWHITFRFVLHEAGTQFNRRTYVRELIESIAEAEGVTFETVLETLRLGASAGAPTGSLPGFIADLAEIQDQAVRAQTRRAPARDPTADLIHQYDALDLFRDWLTGAPTWPRDPVRARKAARSVMQALSRTSASALRDALAGTPLDQRTLAAALAQLTSEDEAALLERLAPPEDGKGSTHPLGRDSASRRLAQELTSSRVANRQRRARPSDTLRRLAFLQAGLTGSGTSSRAWSHTLNQLLRADAALIISLVRTTVRHEGAARLSQLCASASRTRLLLALPAQASAPWAVLSQVLDRQIAGGNDAIISGRLFEGAFGRSSASDAFRDVLRQLLLDLDPGAASQLRRSLMMRLSGDARALVAEVLGSENEILPPPATDPISDVAERLLRWLGCRDGSAAPLEPDELRILLAAPPEGLSRRLRLALGTDRARRRLLRIAPPGLRIRILVLIAPAKAAQLIAAAELFGEAEAAVAGGRSAPLPWRLLFEAGSATGDDMGLVRRMLARRRPATGSGDPVAGRFVLYAAIRHARRTRQIALADRLDHHADRLLPRSDPPRRVGRGEPASSASPTARPRRSDPPVREPAEEVTPVGETWEIDNAGMVLVSGFLPLWLRSLDYLNAGADGKPRLGPREAGRAVHLLQYMVDGRTDVSEPALLLNKLLCGLPLAAAVPLDIAPTVAEIDVCEMLLRSLLAASSVFAGTSMSGFQETFLKRNGLLTRTDEAWRLVVDRKVVDVLLDSTSLRSGLIFHAWMGGPIHVSW